LLGLACAAVERWIAVEPIPIGTADILELLAGVWSMGVAYSWFLDLQHFEHLASDG